MDDIGPRDKADELSLLVQECVCWLMALSLSKREPVPPGSRVGKPCHVAVFPVWRLSNVLHLSMHELFHRKHQRVLLLTAENPRPEFAIPADCELRADLGFTFGDACVLLDGYPIPILPPSGVLQIAA